MRRRAGLQAGKTSASKEVIPIDITFVTIAISICSLMASVIMVVLKIIEVARFK